MAGAAAPPAQHAAPVLQPSRSGLQTAPSAASVSGMSQTSQGRRTPVSMEFPGDHFSFGDIAGLGLPTSMGGVLQHDFFNRGKGFHEEVRERLKLPALVESGRHAGRSRVNHTGAGIGLHLLKRDFFITMLQTPMAILLSLVALVYLGAFLFWAAVWYLIVRYYPGCLYGATTFVESFTFSIVTQMTIGYGNTGPQKCTAAAAIIVVQSVSELLINAVVLGLIFAKVASPKHRAFSIYISDSAIITRRDGILKFMFRVADVRRTQVLEPRVRAYLYTWGGGRVTAEGERIPVRCERLDLDYIDGMLLLPLIIEHTIDERSPLCGHTYDSLAAMSAEIVVTFEATTEMGNPFFARQSYLAQEIYWSCHYAEIIQQPRTGVNPRYRVDLDHFHDVLCTEEEDASEASRHVVNRAKRAVPYPLLGENTLVLSDVLCVRPAAHNGNAMELVCRVADTYPNQMVEVSARMYLYRWRSPEWCAAHPERPSFTFKQLQCGYKRGTDRLYLRLPQEVVHTIDGGSPLASWLEPGGLSADSESEIVVLLQAYLYVGATNRMRQRTYRVGQHVRYGFTFGTCVRPPAECRDGKPRVRWAHFFDIEPVGWSQGGGRPRVHIHASALDNPAVRAFLQRGSTSAAPESHAQVRAQQDRSPALDAALDQPVVVSPRSRWVAAARAAAAAELGRRTAAGGAPDAAQAAAAAAGPSIAAAGPGWPATAAAGARGREADVAAQLEAAPSSAALEPALRQAADVVGRDSTVTPLAPMDRYMASLARASMEVLPPQPTPAVAGGSRGQPAGLGAHPQHQQQQQQQQQQRQQRQQQQQGQGLGAPLTGPPDLGTLSMGYSNTLDRYAAAVSRPSDDAETPQQAGGAAAAAPLPPVHTSQVTARPRLFTLPASPYDQPAVPPPQYFFPQQQGPQQQQQQYRGLPDVLESDLTAMPGVPMDRYAEMVAGPSGDVSPVAGLLQSPQSAALALPPRPPTTAHRVAPPASQQPGSQAGGSGQGIRVPGASEEAGESVPSVPAMGHVGSWRRRRSLAQMQANLQSIFEQPDSAAGSESPSEDEGE